MLMRPINTFYSPTFWATHRDSFMTDKSPQQWKTIKTDNLDTDSNNIKNGNKTFISRQTLVKNLK